LSELEKGSRLRRSATNGFVVAPWRIVYPNAGEHFALAEDNAMVVSGEFDGVRVLLVPQLGKAGQNALFLRHPGLRADIVIAGLPERDEPLAADWLAVLQPQLIVIADSEGSPTGPASRVLLNRLRRIGATVIHTAQSGATTISIRERTWRIAMARSVIGLEPALEKARRDVLDE